MARKHIIGINSLQPICAIPCIQRADDNPVAYGIGFVHSIMGGHTPSVLDHSVLFDLAKGQGQEAGVSFGISVGFHDDHHNFRFFHAHLLCSIWNAAIFFHKRTSAMIRKTNQFMKKVIYSAVIAWFMSVASSAADRYVLAKGKSE